LSYLGWERVQQGLFHPKAWVRTATVVALCLAFGVPVGAILGLLGPLVGGVALLALVAGWLMMRSTITGLIVIIGIICLLPFAALPVNIGFSPTLLDLVLLAVFFVWFSRLVTHKEGPFVASSPTGAILVFLGLAFVSFVAGLSHSQLTANLLRHFAEILLSVLIFMVVLNTVRTVRQLRILVLALILAGFAAALAGVVLYYLPQTLSIRLLSLLRVVRYPTGQDVLRYIEDNPELALRATSTSVDPNVLGGMLVFCATLTAAQVFAEKPLLRRSLLLFILATMSLCMVLTFSRSSFLGLLVAIFSLGVLRYRRILWLGLAIVLVLFVLPPARVYVQHFVEGVQGQDLATQMRFGEYKDALTLILRYPWFGVGFSGTPDIDTYLGVSSVYLLIAEEMGFLGLAAFLVAIASYLVSFLRTHTQMSRGSELEPIYLGTCLAVAGGMVAGALDHYLFNLDFPHAAALLWLVIGLGTASIRLTSEEFSATHAPIQDHGLRGSIPSAERSIHS
jgi:polysaccharide biosynthesis protein PslJ